MRAFVEEISRFLREEGFGVELAGSVADAYCDILTVIDQTFGQTAVKPRTVLAVGVEARTPEQAALQQAALLEVIQDILKTRGEYPLILAQDRWSSGGRVIRARLLAHLQRFAQIYARNCEVRRIDKATAQAFLRENHSYADAACRYRYGLFLKRHTGHNALACNLKPPAEETPEANIMERILPGTLVAVATFSNARKWVKGDRTIRSYEWTRYASLPGIRLSGGMGKILRTFIKEVQPDDIMTYADLEWSKGDVYEQLGFAFEGIRPPVTFSIDTATWSRSSLPVNLTAEADMPPMDKGSLGEVRTGASESCGVSDVVFYTNQGSNKFRMKLTEYQ